MTIEVSEVSKISLAENELLVFTLPDGLCQEEYQLIISGIQASLPENWKKKVLIISGAIKITKIIQ